MHCNAVNWRRQWIICTLTRQLRVRERERVQWKIFIFINAHKFKIVYDAFQLSSLNSNLVMTFWFFFCTALRSKLSSLYTPNILFLLCSFFSLLNDFRKRLEFFLFFFCIALTSLFRMQTATFLICRLSYAARTKKRPLFECWTRSPHRHTAAKH